VVGARRARSFGIFNFAAGFSSVVTFATAALVLTWVSWRWVFRLPVLLLLAGAAVVWLLARDHPVELGFPSTVGADKRASALRREEAANGGASLGARLRAAFSNRPFLLASIGFGFANWARLGLLVWVPSHLIGAAAGAGHGVAWIPLALPIGMAIGALVEGDAVDRVLSGNHPRLIVGSLLLAAVATLGLLAVPADGRSLGLLFVAGFLVFGPFPSFTVLGAELLGPGAVGAGVGFMNAVGYGAAALGDVVMGVVIDATGRTAAIFAVAAGACVLGAGATALAGAAPRRRT
jgi:OPA family glycerol-3-phosphate transporter-like MFS transporter